MPPRGVKEVSAPPPCRNTKHGGPGGKGIKLEDAPQYHFFDPAGIKIRLGQVAMEMQILAAPSDIHTKVIKISM